MTLEDVLAIVDIEQPKGVIVQFGGQTPLKLARELEASGVPIIGTSPEAIDRAEDRERFQQMVTRLGLRQPANATARSLEGDWLWPKALVSLWSCVPLMFLEGVPWK